MVGATRAGGGDRGERLPPLAFWSWKGERAAGVARLTQDRLRSRKLGRDSGPAAFGADSTLPALKSAALVEPLRHLFVQHRRKPRGRIDSFESRRGGTVFACWQ